MYIRMFLLLCMVLSYHETGAGEERIESSSAHESLYRMKHMLLEASPWSSYPIVESVPHWNGRIDTLQEILQKVLCEEKESGSLILKISLKCVVQCDGSLTDGESLARVRQDLAEKFLLKIQEFPKWIPGKVRGQHVKTIILVTLILQGRNIILEFPGPQDGSRLPALNAGFSGNWIHRWKDSGRMDTLRISGERMYLRYWVSGEEMIIHAIIVEHILDSGQVKLKYLHCSKNSKIVHPLTEYFYVIYAGTREVLYICTHDSGYPGRNLLEYNATCLVWNKQE